MSSDSPDRPLPSWANPEGPSESVTEALKALQTYKKKDGEKGASLPGRRRGSFTQGKYSDCTLQGCRKCANHEAELLQNHVVEQVPGSYTVSKEGIGVEGGGTAGVCTIVLDRPWIG